MSAPLAGRRRSLFLPFLLISVGLAALADKLGMISIDFGQIASTFWPLLLIAFGLNLIFGSRRPWVGGALALLVVGAIGVAYAAGVSLATPELRQTSASLPRGTIKSAKLRLDCDASDTAINALEAESQLVYDATLSAARARLDFKNDLDDGVANIRLRADQQGWFSFGGQLSRWEVGLSPELPLDLTLDCNAVGLNADLSELQVKNLSLDLNAGSALLILPERGPTKVTIDANASSLELNIPAGVEAQIKGDFNVTELDLDERFFRGGNAEYHTAGWDPAKGGIEVTIDSSAASLTIR